ncbi:hypothetical protein [Chromatium okenii]|nr:hypothetical protein [Chromatium okenii]
MGFDSVLKSASAPASQVAALPDGHNVPIPTPPSAADPQAADDVW